MIFVDRSRVPVPEILLSDRAKSASAKARAYFLTRPSSRLQTRFNFDPSFWKQSADRLVELFRNKCAYCEWPYVNSSFSDLDHFRPKAIAVGLRGDLARIYGPCGKDFRNGYWWLANDWENLYLACANCNRNKRNCFPVDGPRAKQGARGEALLKERPLLLDPCHDDPETFLHFDAEGHVAPHPDLSKRSASLRRAQITIEVFGLNRQDLVQLRAETAREVQAALKSVPLQVTQWTDNPLENLLHPTKPFLALRRSLVREWAAKSYQQLPAALRVPFHTDLTHSLDVLKRLLTSREGTLLTTALAAIGPAVKLVKTLWETSAGKAALHLLGRGGYIQSVEIKNFKAIEYLKVDIPTGTTDRVGWKVFLGENGAGKSTVLQAVALALLGEHASKFAYRPERMLRRLPGTGGLAKEGFVRVQLSSAPDPIEMRFTPKGITYGTKSALPVDLVLRGYGPTRLMPRRGRRHAPRLRKTDVKPLSRNEAGNLFDPFQPVCNATAWLNGLESKEAFASAALSLKDLLRIPEKIRLHREKGSVIVPLDGLKLTLDELSAGYESVLVLAVDIMSAVHGTADDMRQAAGIVLLDEIDAHLHPRWKMEIVVALRRSFPLMQFLVTTHEPLCLRGLDEGEVVVMRRVGSRIVLEDELPSPAGLRVDQLLTSPYFGLNTTIDPQLERKFTDYYALLAKHEEDLTETERNQRATLRQELSSFNVLGQAPRDQMVYEAIDQYLARAARSSPEERVKLRAGKDAKISEILDNLPPRGEVSS